MKGSIRCNKCKKAMQGVCGCGSHKCYVEVYWKGIYYRFRRDDQGYVLTYDRALDKLIRVNNAIRTGQFKPHDYSDETIEQLKFENQGEKWLSGKERAEQAGELSYGTIRDYRGYVRNYFCFFNASDVREINREQLGEFKDTLCCVSIKTRRNIMAALKNVFNWLIEEGIISAIPHFPKIKGDDAKMRIAIDQNAQDEALKRLPEEQRDIFEFLMETGLRPSEACALLCGDIDIEQGIARIERTFTANRLKNTTKQKRKKAIPLSDRALEIAGKHVQEKLPKQFLFINPRNGKHYLGDTLGRMWRMYSGLAVTLYEATRHSFGSQLIEHNDIYQVKELLRHEDIRTTQKYLHMPVGKLRRVVNSRKNVVEIKKGSHLEVTSRGGK